MQTRDYDDYVYIASTLGFRKVDDWGLEIDVLKETDGYCNLYAGNISLSYLHSMDTYQINAIHYFEENHEALFEVLLAHLAKKYKNPKLELGFKCVNILYKHKNEMCYASYDFIDANKQKIKIMMHQDTIVNVFFNFTTFKNWLNNLFK